MTLPCKGTTAMTQESEQPISVKPNLAAEKMANRFRGFRMYLHGITDLQQNNVKIQDDNIRIIKKTPLGTTKGGIVDISF